MSGQDNDLIDICRMLIKKVKRTIHRRAPVFILAALILGFLTGRFCCIRHLEYDIMSEMKSQMNHYGRTKVFATYIVEDGDTLWDIAGDLILLNPEYRDIRTYIHEIQSINHIPNKGKITEGKAIIIPYFKDPYGHSVNEIYKKYGITQ